MKKLYLARHAKSSWDYPELNDFERPLNKRGNRDAPLMGKILKEMDFNPDLILSSPALRAYSTARIIAEEIDYPLEKIETSEMLYEYGTKEAINLIQSVNDGVSSLIIFGHNPTLTQLNNYFCNNHIGNIPTCGISAIEFNVDSWRKIEHESGSHLFFEFPKKHIKKDL